MKYKVKVITGFNQDQYEVIEADEAHKAYYLFLHPEQRAIFSNGVALRGQDIMKIKPAYNETMGWNPAHVLTTDDWNEIKSLGIDKVIEQKILPKAREIAKSLPPKEMNTPLRILIAERKQLAKREQLLLENKKV